MAGIFETSHDSLPYWWFGFYSLFSIFNILGVELSFRFTVGLTVLALGCLAIFWISCIPHIDFGRNALDIIEGANGKAEHLPGGNGSFLPMGWSGVLSALPFAVWLFLAIEQLPFGRLKNQLIRKEICQKVWVMV